MFASNHQSHFDVPVILMALPGAMARDDRAGDGEGVLQGALLPGRSSRARQVLTNRLNYYLSAFFFNTFPLPQREAGARQTLRYIGEVTGDGYLGADLSGGRALGRAATSSRSAAASA